MATRLSLGDSRVASQALRQGEGTGVVTDGEIGESRRARLVRRGLVAESQEFRRRLRRVDARQREFSVEPLLVHDLRELTTIDGRHEPGLHNRARAQKRNNILSDRWLLSEGRFSIEH